MKLFPLAAWAVFLVSAISEYSLDIDFPLTPPLWLVIGICAMALATAHSTMSSRILGSGKWKPDACWTSDGLAPSESAGVIITANQSPRINNPSYPRRAWVKGLFQDTSQNNYTDSGKGHNSRCGAGLRVGTMSLESEIGSWNGKIKVADTIRGNKTTLNKVQRPAMVAGASHMGNVGVNDPGVTTEETNGIGMVVALKEASNGLN